MSAAGWVVGGVLVVGAGAGVVFFMRNQSAALAAARLDDGNTTALGEKKLGGVAGVVQTLDTFGHTAVCGAVAKGYGVGFLSGLCATSAKLDPAHYASQQVENVVGKIKSGNYSGAAATVLKSGYTIPKDTVTGIYHAISSLF